MVAETLPFDPEGRLLMTQTVVDLFSGVGGLSEGFRQAGCQVLGGVELDPEMARCFWLNHRKAGNPVRAFCRDVQQLEPEDLLAELGIEPGQLTYLVGGPPCQGYSSMGKRRIGDARNELIFEFPRYLRAVQSQAFMIENVPGLIGFQGGEKLEGLLEELAGAGYQNVTYDMVDASACGVPQRRKRVIIYGTLQGKAPSFEHLRETLPTNPTVSDAFSDLPDPLLAAGRYPTGCRIPYSSRAESKYAKLLRSKATKVSRWEPVAHSARVVEAYRGVAQGETEPSTKCWRLMENDLARTLRAGSRTRTACRPIHPTQARVITVREAARLHSFADRCVFPPRKSSAHVAIGNAVPPLMAEALARAFRRVVR